MKFQNAAHSTARPATQNASGNNRGNGICGVVPAVGKIKRQRDNDDQNYEVEAGTWSARSGVLQHDALDYVGNVFAFVDGCFDYLNNFFPLDDLHGVFFFVEKLARSAAA